MKNGDDWTLKAVFLLGNVSGALDTNMTPLKSHYQSQQSDSITGAIRYMAAD